MKKIILLALLVGLVGCSTIAEQKDTSPTVSLETQKSKDDYANCVLDQTATLIPLTKTKTDSGLRLAKGEMGYAGYTIYIDDSNKKGITVIKAYIPSSGWAILPKKMLAAVNGCIQPPLQSQNN